MEIKRVKRLNKMFNRLDWVDTYVYTVDEAQSEGIKFLYWRDWNIQVGMYCLTDDSMVIEVFALLKRKEQMVVRTYYGTVYADLKFKNKLLCIDKEFRGSFSGTREYTDNKRSSITAKQVQFCNNVIKTLNPTEAYIETFPTEGSNTKLDQREAVRLLNNRNVQEYIMENSDIKNVLEDAGLTKEFMLDTLRTMIEDPTNPARLAAWKEASALLNLKSAVKNDLLPPIHKLDIEGNYEQSKTGTE